jgi:hypothetical protein
MNLHQKSLYISKTHSYIGAYYTHLCRDYKVKIVSVSAEHVPDNGFAIEHDSILLPFILEPHRNQFCHHFDANSCSKEAKSENDCIDVE